jgi:glutathione S-transferase
VTQSNATILYVARKVGLAGADEAQQTKVEMALFDVYDLRDALCNMVYWYKGMCRNTAEFEEQKGKYFAEKAAPFFDKQEKWLAAQGTTFFAGDAPTAADFHVWEMLDQHIDFASDVGAASPLEGREKLAAFHAAFKALPQLASYFESDAYQLPCNVPEFAFWSGKGSAIPEDAPKA